MLLGVVMRDGWNGLDLGKALDREVGAINADMPLGMGLTKVTDQAVNISASVDEFMLKFLAALLVVLVVCFASMGWRVGVVVAAAVPLTLAAVFIIMAATGKNFDRITLGSLILALGLLVDDAIIAIEMMVVKMEEGYDRVAASAYAWSHTAAPMLSGTLVTAVGFMPNGFARSTAGEYTSNMFWIVGIALIVSWVVAVVFTPYLGVKMLPLSRRSKADMRRCMARPLRAPAARAGQGDRPKGHGGRSRGRAHGGFRAGHVHREEAVLSHLRPARGDGRGADALRHLHRPDERDHPHGGSLAAAAARIGDRDRLYRPGRTALFLAISPELPDPSFAKIVVRTANQAQRDALKLRLREAISQGLAPQAQVRASQIVFGPYSPFPVAYRVSGPDPQRLRDIAGQVHQVLHDSPMMRTVNSDWGVRTPSCASPWTRTGCRPWA